MPALIRAVNLEYAFWESKLPPSGKTLPHDLYYDHGDFFDRFACSRIRCLFAIEALLEPLNLLDGVGFDSWLVGIDEDLGYIVDDLSAAAHRPAGTEFKEFAERHAIEKRISELRRKLEAKEKSEHCRCAA